MYSQFYSFKLTSVVMLAEVFSRVAFASSDRQIRLVGLQSPHLACSARSVFLGQGCLVVDEHLSSTYPKEMCKWLASNRSLVPACLQ